MIKIILYFKRVIFYLWCSFNPQVRIKKKEEFFVVFHIMMVVDII